MTTDQDRTIQTHQYLGSDGAALAYRTLGSGPVTVTCLHSLALDGSWYEPLLGRLSSSYHYVFPDFRGHGASERGTAPLTLDQLVSDVTALWDDLGVDVSAVMGISLGGKVAQGLIRQHPDRVSAAAIMCTSGNPSQEARIALAQRATVARAPGGMTSLSQPTVRKWFSDEAIEAAAPGDLVTKALTALQSADGDIHAEYLEALSSSDYLDGSSIWESPPPVLVVGGASDRSTSIAAVAELAGSIRGSELVTVPGGHLSAFSHPEGVEPILARFLSQHLPLPGAA